MALCSPPSFRSSVISCKSPSPLFPANPALPSSPYTDQFPSASQLLPSLIERRGIHCSPVRVSAFHTCPDTSSPPSTLYHVLQVPQTATHSEIKSAYRRLARLYHPDAHGAIAVGKDDDKEALTKLFLQIHAAYTTLSDAQARARYDLQLSAQALQDRIVRTSTPLSAGSSYSSARASPAFSPYRVGRSWETDQCWC